MTNKSILIINKWYTISDTPKYKINNNQGQHFRDGAAIREGLEIEIGLRQVCDNVASNHPIMKNVVKNTSHRVIGQNIKMKQTPSKKLK